MRSNGKVCLEPFLKLRKMYYNRLVNPFFFARSVMHLGDDRWKSILNYGPHLVSNKVHKENEKGASTAFFEFPSKFWKDNLPPFVRRSKALCNRLTVNCWCGPPDRGSRRLLYKLMGKFGCYFKQKLSYLKKCKISQKSARDLGNHTVVFLFWLCQRVNWKRKMTVWPWSCDFKM